VKRSRTPILFLLLAGAVAAPGCCGRFERADTARSFDFMATTVGGRVSQDAQQTGENLSGVWPAIVGDVNSAPERWGNTCTLYYDGL
jgi:hypothetical protein